MSISADLVIKYSGYGILCAFVPMTAFALRGIVAKRKRLEFERVVKTYNLGKTSAFRRLMLDADSHIDDDTWSNFVAPVLFATALCLVGLFIPILGHETGIGKAVNVILVGAHVADQPDVARKYQQHTLIVVGFAFLGAYIWAMFIILRRMITIDLTPTVYYNMSLRLIFATLVAITLRHALDALTLSGDAGQLSVTDRALPVVAFLAGMMPDRALTWLREQSKIFSDKKNDFADDFALERIEGISVYKKARLLEIAIDNAHNLAQTNPLELVFRTPYRLAGVIDWIAQAQLYLYVKKDGLADFRKANIRSILGFCDFVSDGRNLADLSATMNCSEASLQNLHLSVSRDPAFVRLKEVRDCVLKTDNPSATEQPPALERS